MALPAPSYGSTVVITGASSGIGADMARQLAERGYNLTLVARRRERLEELADELREAHDVHVDVETCDLGSPQQRGRSTEKLQEGEREVVGLCNNAGFGNLGNFLDNDLEAEGDVVKLNVEALHELTGAFLPRMVEQGAGAVLNVASTAAFQPLPGFATYAASKAFVHSFSEAVHSELSGTGVSVTSLCPGFTQTEFEQAAGAEDAASKLPGFTWMESDDVARQAIEGMLAGKRTVVPGALTRRCRRAGATSRGRCCSRSSRPRVEELAKPPRFRRDQQLAGHPVGGVGRARQQPPRELRAAEIQRRVVLPRRADPAALNLLKARRDTLLPGTLHHSGLKPAPPSDHIPLARRSAFPTHSGSTARLCNNVAAQAPGVPVQVHSFFQIAERSTFVNELYSWLSSQHPGLKTFKALQLKLLRLAADHPERRAMCRLLHGIVGSLSRNSIKRRCRRQLPIAPISACFEHWLTSIAMRNRQGSSPTSTAWPD